MRWALIVALQLLVLRTVAAQQRDSAFLDLRGLAAFRTGDDDTWRSRFIDEGEGWNFIPVPGAWQRAGYPLHHGMAWYRIRFRVPPALAADSLLLVMSGVDDADETFLNGALIGKTGEFPPRFRSELQSLRVYPLPRTVLEDHNLIAVRVYDQSDSGGLTGSIVRIIRQRDLPGVLNEIVDAPFRAPPLFISNGVMISAIDPAARSLLWSRPHLYSEIERGLTTETILTDLAVSVLVNGQRQDLSAFATARIGFKEQSGAVEMEFDEGCTVTMFHPASTAARILVVTIRFPRGGRVSDPGVRFSFSKPYWKFREMKRATDREEEVTYIFSWHSCCEEFAERDIEAFLARAESGGPEPYSLERSAAVWRERSAPLDYLPGSFSDAEKRVYRQSAALLLAGTVREPGAGSGQIVSAFTPPSRAYAVPRDHFLASAALSRAGLTDAAGAALDFARHTVTGRYTFHQSFNTEVGIGFAHLITPAFWYGSGSEFVWPKSEQAEFSAEGLASYIEALDAQRDALHREASVQRKPFSDSAFVATYWKDLSVKAADVLMYMRDSSGLLSSVHRGADGVAARRLDVPLSARAAHALRIAAGYARLLHDRVKEYLYNEAARQTGETLRSRAAALRARSSAERLTAMEEAFFDPFLVDAVTLGIFPPGSSESTFALEMTERAFAIEDAPESYNMRPDGDWFGRQSRPQLALRLARAYAANGNRARAEQLFASVTRLADAHNGMIPELIDPVSKNWYGAIPALGAGSAEYILTAEAIAALRIGTH